MRKLLLKKCQRLKKIGRRKKSQILSMTRRLTINRLKKKLKLQVAWAALWEELEKKLIVRKTTFLNSSNMLKNMIPCITQRLRANKEKTLTGLHLKKDMEEHIFQ